MIKRNSYIKFLAVVLLGISFQLVGKPVSALQDRPIDFNRDIRPIVSDKCFSCHGPDDKQRKARLRFDTREGLFSKSGVIVPGDSSKSRLYQRITARDKDQLMPPPDSGYALTANEIELFRKWLDQGAKWSAHWAYSPPQRPQPPAVKNSAWTRNSIDNFILARLEREGLQPSPETDRVTLLRRVTLDLTGLPPTPAEIDSFLADQSPDAYEKRVDELLRSPHYGERMAMQWMDLARYADTHGYHIDSHRDMWPWRDWLIAAFNKNVPYDKFTVEQLAGDLLPNATLDQQIASGFNRNHMINFEGGAIPEEYQVEYVVDRVEATATTWMGMTMGCARCHTHKFDPISQREFYQFFAFFNNVPEDGLDGRTGNARPSLPMPSEAQKTRMEELNRAMAAALEKLSDKEVGPLEEAWQRPFTGKIGVATREGLVAHYELDGNFSDLSGRYQHGHAVRGDPNFVAGMVGRAVGFDGDSQVTFGNVGDFDRGDPFTISCWMRATLNQPNSFLQKIDAGPARRGYEFFIDNRELIGIQRWSQYLTFRLIDRWPESAIQIRTPQRLAMGEWYQVTVTSDGSGRAAGLHLFINGEQQQVTVVQDELKGSFRTAAPLQIGDRALGRAFSGGLDDLRIYDRVLTPDEITQLAVHYPIQTVLSGVFGKRTKEDDARVREYFLTRAAPEELRRQAAELKRLRKERDQLNKEILTVMVMGDLVNPRDTFVLARGDYRNRTEKVTADVPSVLPPLPPPSKDAPRNRLTLAKWLVDPGHPLTARVAVNRYWQLYFGLGIVKTAEDFGTQGEPPVHPELLDWLATEFVRTGWDVKAMQRLIVTSATYRQSSKIRPDLRDRDPENRLLARGPRQRLSAEIIRDTALAASGLLNGEIGGPSVFPYQPRGLWEEMSFGDGFSAQEYRQSKGKDLYRRSLYTFWKRTVPPASLATFDAPDREKCTARRLLTNTPLQALVLLNDPTYIEASRALAARALLEGGTDANGRVGYLFRLATARKPSARELQILRALLTKETISYRRDREAALKLLRVGESAIGANVEPTELAAWTVVASAILNLDETITKE